MMDRLIKRFSAIADGDLMVCKRLGVAYQRNMELGRVPYDAAYFEHYRTLGGSTIEQALNAGRGELLKRHTKAGAKVLDVGVGSGSFVLHAKELGFDIKGSDINPVAIKWLEDRGLLAETLRGFDAITFWDSLEHIENPESAFKRIGRNAVVLAAIPVVEDLSKVRESKHYKPGEHLYYWTSEGFIAWMALSGFRLIERSDHEVAAGRESITAFAFKRDLPDYDYYIAAYREMHTSRYYGGSATELHLAMVTELVAANRPRSILDFGCGRSDIVSHFYLDGRRRIARYDPAVPFFERMPEEHFDMVLCCDVLEHIPLAAVDQVLEQIKAKGDITLFTISTKLAKARLPDGTNAHVTLLSNLEWENWLRDVFGSITVLPAKAEHECNVLVGKKAKAPRHFHACHCGGVVKLDSFNPVDRPVEWFMRCIKCGGMGPACSTEAGAERGWPGTTILRTGPNS